MWNLEVARFGVATEGVQHSLPASSERTLYSRSAPAKQLETLNPSNFFFFTVLRARAGSVLLGALDYLAARRQANGSYAYRAGLVQTPAWVTSQVLPAVNGRAYPIR